MQALAIQCIAATMTLALVFGASRLAGVVLSIGHAALLQGFLAAVLTVWRGLARWWVGMQALFPVALLTTLALHLPPVIFLAAFMFLLLLYWSTFRTQVPFYPSGPRVWKAVHDLLPEGGAPRMVDIGSGLGGLVLALARQRPDGDFTGIELAPLPWLISLLRAGSTGSRAHFVRGDYAALDLAQFDLVFAYLSPAAMPGLWQKVQREMRPGSLLLSYEFPIVGEPPHLTVLPNPHGPVLYGWRR